MSKSCLSRSLKPGIRTGGSLGLSKPLGTPENFPRIPFLLVVSVCLGGYNQIPQTGCLIDNRHLSSYGSGGWRSKTKVPNDLAPGLWTAVFSLCPPVLEGKWELSGVSSVTALVPFMRVPPS